MQEPGPLDHAAIERLRRLGDDAFVRSMIELFFSFVTEKMARAAEACAQGDLVGFANAVHAIKSTAGNAGAVQVQTLASQAEQAARAQDVPSVRALLEQLQQAYAEVAPCLEKEKARLGG